MAVDSVCAWILGKSRKIMFECGSKLWSTCQQPCWKIVLFSTFTGNTIICWTKCAFIPFITSFFSNKITLSTLLWVCRLKLRGFKIMIMYKFTEQSHYDILSTWRQEMTLLSAAQRSTDLDEWLSDVYIANSEEKQTAKFYSVIQNQQWRIYVCSLCCVVSFSNTWAHHPPPKKTHISNEQSISISQYFNYLRAAWCAMLRQAKFGGLMEWLIN